MHHTGVCLRTVPWVPSRTVPSSPKSWLAGYLPQVGKMHGMLGNKIGANVSSNGIRGLQNQANEAQLLIAMKTLQWNSRSKTARHHRHS